MSDQPIDGSPELIAIIGMAGRFPGAKTLHQFWENLRDGVEGITFFSDAELEAAGVNRALLDHPKYVKARAVLEDIDRFDAGFFGFTPREAELMDPQHRLFLECAWESLEDAGYVPESYDGVIGVFGSTLMSSYLLYNLYPNQELIESAGALAVRIATDRDFLPTRVSYKLDLKGPSFCVQTACSSTLVGCHLAIKSLLDYECDIALVGGVSISVPQQNGYLYQEGGIYSPDGHCRAFDAQARGTVIGSGMGIVVLKRLDDALEDGDTIRAVIRGSAINNDGSLKVGYTAPSVEAQAEVITMAQTVAKADPETISYIEAHGTGTSLGDLVEVTALTQVFRENTDATGFCAIGSVKTNIGHLDAAAGVAGLIKTVLALQNKQIPPSLGYEQPNPEIDFANSPFRVNAALTDWISPSGPRRAGISSFAVGGTNAHVVLEEAPTSESDTPARSQHLLVLSARSAAALEQATDELAAHLAQQPDLQLADVAYTLQRGRRAFDERRVVVCSDPTEATAVLRNRDPERVFSASEAAADRSVVFMFPGQGAQYVGMGRELYEREPIFRAEIDRCAQIVRPHLGLDLREIVFPSEQRAATAAQQLQETWLTQPVIFVIEYALAKLWMAWGITPKAMIGHSIGEYVAACLADVFSLEDALTLVAARGRLMQTLPGGAMLSVALPAVEVEPLLQAEGRLLSLAAINGPALCVVAGPLAAIEALQTRLSAQGVTTRQLHTSHAFHSAMMDPIIPQFVDRLRRVRLRTPQLPYLSNVTGTWITPQQATDPNYWGQHLRQPVRFAEGMGELLQTANRALLEVGPGRTLSTFARQQTAAVNSAIVATSLRHPHEHVSDVAFLLTALGQLWLGGTVIDWAALYGDERRLRVPLPTYPFERQSYWVEQPTEIAAPAKQITTRKQADSTEWFYSPLWKESRLLQPSQPSQPALDRWIVLAEAGDAGQALGARLSELGHRVTVAQPANEWNLAEHGIVSINPTRLADLQALLQTADIQPGEQLHVVFVLSATDPQRNGDDRHHAPRCDLATLIAFAETLDGIQLPVQIQLTALTSDAQDVTGAERLVLEHTPVAGVMQRLGKIVSRLSCRGLDLSSDRPLNRRQIDQLIAEIASPAGSEPVAYRRGRRWLQVFEPQRLERPATPMEGLRANGVYLLTDGLSPVGLALAEHLAHTVQARLVLLGPADFPAREQWPHALKADSSTAQIILRLQALEQAGPELLMLPTAATAPALQVAIAAAQQHWGEIHGVIHGIGQAQPGQTAAEQVSLTLDETRQQLDALSVLAAADLDFVLLHAPLTPMLSGAAVLAEAARVALMHGVARQRSQHDAVDWLSIVWDAPSDAEADEWTMSADELVEVFGRILANRSPLPQIVATGDLLARQALTETPKSATTITQASTGAHYDRPSLATVYVPPVTPAEHRLVDLWQELLGIAPVGIHDTFFDLGGHSLLATQLLSRIRDTFNVSLSLSEFFEASTIARVAQRIATATSTPGGTLQVIPVAPRDGTLPLSFAQRQLWFLHQLNPDNIAYNMPFAVQLSGSLNYRVLEQSIAAIVERHESLRTTFAALEGAPYQVINPVQPVPLPLFDLEPLPVAEQQTEIQRRIMAEVQCTFDLDHGPLIRALLLRLNAHEHVLVVTIHHIVFDGWSMGVFTRELTALYQAFVTGQPSPLPELAIQYADYAVWQQTQVGDLDDQLAFWKQQLNGCQPVELPMARARPEVPTLRSAQQTFEISATAAEVLKTLSTQESVTLFITLMTALKTLLYHHTRQEDLIVGTGVANRNQAATEALIGFFVNQLVLRTNLSGDPTYREVLQRVRDVTLAAFDHRDVPFDKVLDAIRPGRDDDHLSLVRVKMLLQNTPMPTVELPDLVLKPLPVETSMAKFDLSVNLFETGQGFIGVMEYDTDIFDQPTIAHLATQYAALLERMSTLLDLRLSELSALLAQQDQQHHAARQAELRNARLQKFKKLKPKTA